jgi:flagellar hook-basal body complex protein FliE
VALTTSLNAASVYGTMQKLANRGPGEQTGPAGAGGLPDFGAMVREQVQGVVEQGRVAEARQADLMAGKAELIDVVTAVSETELALETMVSVRDRVITAYEEIMRMPI